MFDVKETEFFDIEDDTFDTILEDDIRFSGTIKFVKPFMIRGKVSGRIDATSDLVIDSSAEVEADVTAERVLVKGMLRGNVSAQKMLFVTSSGILEGDVSAEQVVLAPGSFFSGRCTMQKRS